MAKQKRTWRKVSAEDRARQYDKRTRRGVSYLNTELPMFVPQDGENVIRIIPPLADDKYANSPFGMDILINFLDGNYYVNPRTFDEKAHDPALDAFRRYREKDREMAREFSATRRTLMFILDLNKDDAGELKLWAAPASVIDDFVKQTKSRRTGEVRSLEDPEYGHPVYFEKEGTGLNTRYVGIQLDQEPFPLDDVWLDEIEYFEDILEAPDPDGMAEAVTLMLAEFEGGEARPARGQDEPAPRRRRRAKPEPDPEEAEEEDDEEEADEAPPARTRRRRAKPEPDPEPEEAEEEDDEEEDDDEAEEEAAPRTRRRAPTAERSSARDAVRERVRAGVRRLGRK